MNKLLLLAFLIVGGIALISVQQRKFKFEIELEMEPKGAEEE